MRYIGDTIQNVCIIMTLSSSIPRLLFFVVSCDRLKTNFPSSTCDFWSIFVLIQISIICCSTHQSMLNAFFLSFLTTQMLTFIVYSHFFFKLEHWRRQQKNWRNTKTLYRRFVYRFHVWLKTLWFYYVHYYNIIEFRMGLLIPLNEIIVIQYLLKKLNSLIFNGFGFLN